MAYTASGLCFFLLLGTCPQQTSAPTFLQVHTRSSFLHPLPGTEVSVDSGTGAPSVYVSDGSAMTSLFAIPGDAPLVLRFKEKETAEGTALGQEVVLSEPFGSEVETCATVHYFQPFLRSVRLKSDAIVASGLHTRWLAAPHDLDREPGAYDFDAKVGSLLTREQIDGYLQYHGVDLGVHFYRTALVIRAEEVTLGEPGMDLLLDCRGHDFSYIPTATALQVIPGAEDGAQTTFSAISVDWSGPDFEDEHVRVHVTGSFLRGDNIILLSDPLSPQPAPQAGPLLSTAPGFSLPVSQTGRVEDCEVQPPLPPAGAECDEDSDPCLPDCPCSTASEETETQTRRLDEEACLLGGELEIRRIVETYVGSVEVKGKLRGRKVDFSGKISQGIEDTVQYTGQRGTECGECYASFAHDIVTTRMYLVEKKLFGDCLGPYQDSIVCVRTIAPSQNKCDRICGDEEEVSASTEVPSLPAELHDRAGRGEWRLNSSEALVAKVGFDSRADEVFLKWTLRDVAAGWRGKRLAAAHQVETTPYQVTSLLVVDGDTLLVAGYDETGATVLEEWTVQAPRVTHKAAGSGMVRLTTEPIACRRELLRTHERGKSILCVMCPTLGSTGSVLVQFYDSKDVYRLEVDSGSLTLQASPTAGPVTLEALAGPLKSRLWIGEHVVQGYVYTFASPEILIPPVALIDRDKDGRIDVAVEVTAETSDALGLGDASQYR